MKADNNSTSFFSRRDGFPENILLFIEIYVHIAKWVVTLRTYDLELKTFSMMPSAEELSRS